MRRHRFTGGEAMHVDGEIGAGRRRFETVEHRVEIALHLAGGLVARGGILLQRFEHDGVRGPNIATGAATGRSHGLGTTRLPRG